MGVPQVVAIALLLAVLSALVAGIAHPDWLERQRMQEIRATELWLGKVRTDAIYARAQGWVASMFPPAATGNEITGEAASWFGPFAQAGRAQAVVTQALFRLLAMLYTLMLATPLIVAAMVDGITIRQKKQEMLHSENPRMYHTAKNALIAIIIAPVIIVALPLALGPLAAMAWCAATAFTVWGMAQNVEREI